MKWVAAYLGATSNIMEPSSTNSRYGLPLMPTKCRSKLPFSSIHPYPRRLHVEVRSTKVCRRPYVGGNRFQVSGH